MCHPRWTLAAAALLAATTPAPAVDYVWNVAANGNWNLNTNWAPTGIPNSTADNATLGTLASGYTVSLTDTRTVNNLTINTGAALNQTGNLTVGGAFAINTGVYNLQANTLFLSNGSAATTSGTGQFNWTGGQIAGPATGTATIAATIAAGGGDKYVFGDTLQFGGILNWVSGPIYTNGTTTRLTVMGGASPGLIDFQANGTAFAINTGTGTLENRGVIRKSLGTGTTTVGWAVDLRDGGRLENLFDGSTLAFTGGGTLSNGTTTVSRPAGGTGVVALAGGTFSVPAGATFTAASANGATLNWTGGQLAGVGTVAGVVTAGGGDKYVFGDTLQLGGTLNWLGGLIYTNGSTTRLTVLPGGAIDFQANNTAFAINTGTGTLANAGTLKKTAGTGTTTVNWAVDLRDGGRLEGQAGVLNLAGGGTLSNGTTTVGGTGVVALAGGTFSVPAGATFVAGSSGGATLNWTGGQLAGPTVGVGTVAGVVTAGGGDKYVFGDTLQLGGTLNWLGGLIYTNGSTTRLTVLPGGAIDFQANNTAFAINTGTGTLANAGTLKKTAGTGTTTVNWAVENSGTVNSLAGTLSFGGGLTNKAGGIVLGPAGVTANYGGTMTFEGGTLSPGGNGSAGGLVLGGTLNLTGGAAVNIDLTGPNPVSGFDQIAVNGTVTLGTVALGNATLTGTTGAGFTPTLGPGGTVVFILLNDSADAITGTFSSGATGTIGGYSFQISYVANSANGSLTGGNDIALHNFQPVPEPGAVLAVGAAGLGAAGLVRRRARRGAAA